MTSATSTRVTRRGWAGMIAVVLGLSAAIVPGLSAESATGYSISGHVYVGDTSRSAVAGEAQIVALYPNSSYLTAMVDASGDYTITGVGSRTYVLLLRYLGTDHFSTVYYPAVPATYNAGMWTNPSPGPLDPTPVVVAGADVTGRDFVVPSDGQITIHVEHGDSSHPAVTGSATVGGSPVDASGNIVVWSDIGTRAITADSVLYDWERGSTTANIVSGPNAVTVTLPPVGVVTGRVTLGETGHYAGLGEVTLKIRGMATSDVPFRTVTTDADGYYSVGARAGTYYLEATLTTGLEYQILTKTVTTAPATQLVSDYVLLPGARFTGTVTVDGRPAHEGEVIIRYEDSGDQERWVATQSDGSYDLRGLIRSWGTLSFTHVDDRYPVVSEQSIQVTSTAITRNTQLNLGGTIAGHVDGKKWRNVRVIAIHNGWYETKVDDQGDYLLAHLPAGDYNLLFEAPLYPGGATMYWGESYSDYTQDLVTVSVGDRLVDHDMTMYDGNYVSGGIYCVKCPAVPDGFVEVSLQYETLAGKWKDVPGAEPGMVLVSEGNEYSVRTKFPGTYRLIARPLDSLKRYLSTGTSASFTVSNSYVYDYRDINLTRAGSTAPLALIRRPVGGWQKPSPLSAAGSSDRFTELVTPLPQGLTAAPNAGPVAEPVLLATGAPRVFAGR